MVDEPGALCCFDLDSVCAWMVFLLVCTFPTGFHRGFEQLHALRQVLAFCLRVHGLVSWADITAVFQLCASPSPPLDPAEDFQGRGGT